MPLYSKRLTICQFICRGLLEPIPYEYQGTTGYAARNAPGSDLDPGQDLGQ